MKFYCTGKGHLVFKKPDDLFLKSRKASCPFISIFNLKSTIIIYPCYQRRSLTGSVS